MSNNGIIHNSDDDLGDFDITPASEGDLLGEDSGGLDTTQHSHMRSNFSGKPPWSSTSSTPEMRVVSS
jgi:hypothetical protein